MLLRKVYEVLKSVRVTAVLIIALAVLFLVGLLVPQKKLIGPEIYQAWKTEHPFLLNILDITGFTSVYTSPLMMFIWGFFFLNLVVVLFNRMPGILKRCKQPIPLADHAALTTYRHCHSLEGHSLAHLEGVLRKKHYGIVTTSTSLAAVRNRFAPLATLLFHLSFLLLLAGGIATFYTKFRAEADVAVGEEFNGHYTKILARPKLGKAPSPSFSVIDIKPTYYDRNIPVELIVRIADSRGEKEHAINRPYKYGSISFAIMDIDVAPSFSLRDSSGKELDGAFVKLKVLKGEEDSFQMAGYTFKTRFITNTDGKRSSKDALANLPQALKQGMETPIDMQDKEIINPACEIEVYRGKAFLGKGLLKKGEAISFEDKKLFFDDWTYWVHFYVGAERGLLVVYFGFIAMIAALIVRFGFYRREIHAVLEDGILHVAGSAEYFPHLFSDEFESLISDVSSVVRKIK